jgi:hypothetical protein
MTDLATLLVFFGSWGIIYAGLRRIRLNPLLLEIVGASGLLALLTAGFFWQILLVPNTWMPAGGGDLAPFLFPNYRFAAEQLKQGVIPLWNPHLYGGIPFAADIQNGLFYPINLVLFFSVPKVTFTHLQWLAIFHFWWAGTAMYLLLRLGGKLHPLAALAGAVAFEFSDLFVVHFGNLNMIAVAAWLPLVFLCFQKALERHSAGLAALAGTLLAGATLAGHVQITLFILLAVGMVAVWTAVTRLSLDRPADTAYASQTSFPGFLYPIGYLGLTLGVTIGLSALLLLPAYEMSQHTPRANLPYVEAAQYSLHPAQVAGLLVPNFFGRDPALHWGPWNRVETGYIGILTLVLALLAVILRRGWLRGFFIGLALLAFVLALGGEAVLHGWLYALVPGFNQLRAPARFILLLDFALAALAASGLDALLHARQADQSPLRRLLASLSWIVGGLLVVSLPLSYFALLLTQDRDPAIFQRAAAAAQGTVFLALLAGASLTLLYLAGSGRLRGLGLGLSAIGLIVFDLFSLGSGVDVGRRDPTSGFQHAAALAFLKSDAGHDRLEVTTDVWHWWQPNTALLNELYDVWGLYNPLALADTRRYWEGIGERRGVRYNFLGVKYIVAGKGGAPADAEPGAIVPVFDGDPEVNVYLNRAALPRLLFVGRAVAVDDHEEAWRAIGSSDFVPARAVILEDLAILEPETSPQASLALLAYELHRVHVEVETDVPGYLVLSDAYYPGWQAKLDGQPTPLYRANFAFRAVRVPAGKHLVSFEFRPRIWLIGLGLSGLTAVGLVIWAILFITKLNLRVVNSD